MIIEAPLAPSPVFNGSVSDIDIDSSNSSLNETDPQEMNFILKTADKRRIMSDFSGGAWVMAGKDGLNSF
jgi:hypothetical protein